MGCNNCNLLYNKQSRKLFYCYLNIKYIYFEITLFQYLEKQYTAKIVKRLDYVQITIQYNDCNSKDTFKILQYFV